MHGELSQGNVGMSTKRDWTLHGPGIEPGPPAWQARILPLNHPCLDYNPSLDDHTVCAAWQSQDSSAHFPPTDPRPEM